MTLRVIGAGVGRTGTTSLKVALEKLLGGPCYHMYEVLQSPKHVALWHDAVRCNPVDWEDLFDGYAATVDWPSAAFWQQLSKAYPDALVLLSVRRSSAEWFASAQGTIGALMSVPPGPGTQAWHAMASELLERTFTPAPFEEAPAITAYERHNAAVRAAIPSERLVEWSPGDGWAPLCEALGVPAPAEEFPHLNKSAEFRALLDNRPQKPNWRQRLRGLTTSLTRTAR
ncbi:MAG: sulfotransferase family protein [Actinomycetes bacterium]